MGKGEKMLVTSIFSFSFSVFKRTFAQGHQKLPISGKGSYKQTLMKKNTEVSTSFDSLHFL